MIEYREGSPFFELQPPNQQYTLYEHSDFIGAGCEGLRGVWLQVQGLEFPCVIKTPYKYDHIPAAAEYVQKWQYLTASKLPTHPWMVVHNEWEVLMPNLVEAGWSFYGKNRCYDLLYCKQRDLKPYLDANDSLFLEIDPKEVFEKTQKIARSANQANFILPSDDPFELIVNSQLQQWGLIISDLSQASTGGREIEEDNARYTKSFLEKYGVVYHLLTDFKTSE